MRRTLLLVVAALLALGAVPAEAAEPAAAGVPEQVSGRAAARALFFGDSYFVGGGCSPDPKAGMAHLAGKELGYRPVVRGAGGTGFVAANPDYGQPAYLAQVAAGALEVQNPRLVVIEGGSNDIGQPIKKVRRNAKKVLRIAREKHPGALLVLVGPFDTYGGYADTDPIVAGLRAVARRTHVRFVNPQKWVAGRDDLLCSDYVHPTYEGQAFLGHKLAAVLKRRGA